MSKGSLNKEKVYLAIKRYMAEYGKVPTCLELQGFIGSGSLGTVHRYLSSFKMEQFGGRPVSPGFIAPAPFTEQ